MGDKNQRVLIQNTIFLWLEKDKKREASGSVLFQMKKSPVNFWLKMFQIFTVVFAENESNFLWGIYSFCKDQESIFSVPIMKLLR